MLRFWAKVIVPLLLVLLYLSSLPGHTQTAPTDTTISQPQYLDQQIDSLRSSIEQLKEETYKKSLDGINRTVTLITIAIGFIGLVGAYLIIRGRNVEKDVRTELERVETTKSKLEERIQKGMDRTEDVLHKVLELKSEIEKIKIEIDQLLSEAKEAKGVLDKEIEDARKIIEAKSKVMKMDITRSIEEIPKKDSTEAINIYEDLIKKLFGSKVFWSMAVNYYLAGMSDEALVEIKKYTKTAPLDGLGYALWAGVLLNKNQLHEALRIIETGAELYPSDYHVNTAWGLLLAIKRDFNGAKSKLTKAMEASPEDAWPLYFRASVHGLTGDKELMITDLKRAVNLNPKMKEDALKDKRFEKYWGDPDFIDIAKS